MHHAERLARASIREMPAGSWSAEDHGLLTTASSVVSRFKVSVKVTIDPGEEITFDYTESAKQQVGPTNSPTISTVSVSRMLQNSQLRVHRPMRARSARSKSLPRPEAFSTPPVLLRPIFMAGRS